MGAGRQQSENKLGIWGLSGSERVLFEEFQKLTLGQGEKYANYEGD